MVMTVSVSQIFKIPVNDAVKLFYKNQEEFRKLDGELKNATEGEQIHNDDDGPSCNKTTLTYKNFIPRFLQKELKMPMLQVENIDLEEESWVDLAAKHYWFRYRNITWSDGVSIQRTTAFTAAEDNPNWTKFECEAGVSVEATDSRSGEAFEHFLKTHVKKIIDKNIEVFTEKIKDSGLEDN